MTTKLKRAQIGVFDGNELPLIVKAYLSKQLPGLAIHRKLPEKRYDGTYEQSKDLWTITHIGSGKCFGLYFEKRKQAIAGAAAATKLSDWTLDETTILQSLKGVKIRHIVTDAAYK